MNSFYTAMLKRLELMEWRKMFNPNSIKVKKVRMGIKADIESMFGNAKVNEQMKVFKKNEQSI